MVLMGDRLRLERDRLGLTQEAMADAVGITKKTQGLYERNHRSPNADYLAALSDLGVDVLYVLTGQRSASGTAEQAASYLTPRESALLLLFNDLSEEAQGEIQSAVAEKKRLLDLEKRISELEESSKGNKKMA